VLRLIVQSLKIVSIVTVAILILVGARVGFDYAMGRVADPDAGKPVEFNVTADDNGDTVAARLHDADLIQSETYFTYRLQLSSGNLAPGDYDLELGMSVPEIIDAITVDEDGDRAASSDDSNDGGSGEVQTTQVTVIENLRLEQIAKLYGDAGLQGGAEAFMAATREDYSDSFPFLADRPEGATLEGYLFPETYTVSSDLTAEDAVFQMLTVFDERFNQDLRDRASQMGLTMHQVLTVASIVEREAQAPAERPTIAAVYLNRIEAGMTLDADPTVQYVIGNESDWWPVLEPGDPQSPEAQSPYNTYVNQGLPPGPICNPSYDSIFAVLQPDPVDYLYFVAKNDGSGEHAFAVTLDEQQANIDLYLNGGGGDSAEPTEAPEG
jgi:UPF0755 protein